MSDSVALRVRAAMRDIPDFPTPGILFKDITPILADPVLMADVVHDMVIPFRTAGVSHVVAIESRGFLFGMPMALELGVAFAPARKPGKLPWSTASEGYALEYRTDTLEMHLDALGRGARVLLVDDILATGGTAAAAARLVARLGGEVVGLSVLSELTFLGARARLREIPVHAIVSY
ncbi:MAG: adenine phosphoribosyltransferase [Gemmatimonadaceae bacterium]|nr:adenine phosphoribosyltransferase [Gemmatimonadaceae bacterium]